jgi:hypothetical protein
MSRSYVVGRDCHNGLFSTAATLLARGVADHLLLGTGVKGMDHKAAKSPKIVCVLGVRWRKVQLNESCKSLTDAMLRREETSERVCCGQRSKECEKRAALGK